MRGIPGHVGKGVKRRFVMRPKQVIRAGAGLLCLGLILLLIAQRTPAPTTEPDEGRPKAYNIGKPVKLSLPTRPLRVESLKNAGFTAGTDGWSATVIGAEAAIEVDAQMPHGQSASLRVAAKEPSDAAIAQELQLSPG